MTLSAYYDLRGLSARPHTQTDAHRYVRTPPSPGPPQFGCRLRHRILRALVTPIADAVDEPA